MNDFEVHPVGTTDRIKKLEEFVAGLKSQLDQAMWQTDYYDEQLETMWNLFAEAEVSRQVLLGRVEELEAELKRWQAVPWDKYEE
jgi:hypothetical protein